MAKYGFYSEQASTISGTSIYSTPEGAELEVTCVTTDPEGKEYRWPDKEYVGEVVDWLRKGEVTPERYSYRR